MELALSLSSQQIHDQRPVPAIAAYALAAALVISTHQCDEFPTLALLFSPAVKMAYEQEPLDALSDAHRLLKMLGERYTQVVNRDLLP